MTLWRERGRWRYQFMLRGQRYSSGPVFATKAEARAAQEDRRRELQKSFGLPPTPDDITFRSLASAYLDWAERRFAKLTYQYKAFVYRQFILHVGKDVRVSSISPHDIHRYLITRPSNNNYNVHRKELSALFEWGIRQFDLPISNPARKVDRLPHATPRKRIPTEDAILRLIMAADPETERPLLLVILMTLARVDEILRLRWEDVNFSAGSITLFTRKRRDGAYHGDTLPMNEDLARVLRELWQRREQDEWVFLNPATRTRYLRRPKLMPGLCRRAGIDPPFGFHALRHFMATYLADKMKVSKKTISGLLRHQSLATTEIYLGSVEESQRVAMRGLEGRFFASKSASESEQKSTRKTGQGGKTEK